MKRWPAGGPKLVWAYKEAGIGYSGAIVGGTLYIMIMGAWDNKEYVYPLDAKTSKRLWATCGRRARSSLATWRAELRKRPEQAPATDDSSGRLRDSARQRKRR